MANPPCPCSTTATGSHSLARKSSDTSSSESTSVTADEHGCGSFIMNFLHLRSHAVDAVVDDNDDTKKKEDADAGMMEEAEMDMALQDDAGDTPLETTQPVTSSTNCSSPSPKDIQGKTHLGTKTPVLPPKSIDIVDIFSNENQSSIDLTMPKLSKSSSPPESLPQTHLISGTAGNTIDEDSPSSLSLHSVSAAQTAAVTQSYEGMMSNIPRIHLRMRNSRQPIVHRVTEDVDQSKRNRQQ
jgi:hypothetical protein